MSISSRIAITTEYYYYEMYRALPFLRSLNNFTVENERLHDLIRLELGYVTVIVLYSNSTWIFE